jgi:5-methylcytosine-specific restriction protein A
MSNIKHPCRRPGCRRLLDSPGFCEDHREDAKAPRKDYEIKRMKDPALRLAAKIRSGRRWQKVRAMKLSRDPLCEDPLGDHERCGDTASATQVHHIKPLAEHPELAYHMHNLMSICTKCHSKIEAQIRFGD